MVSFIKVLKLGRETLIDELVARAILFFLIAEHIEKEVRVS